ncbi:MAG: phosphoglycerate kinase [bacterium]
MAFLDSINVKCINELALREKRVFIRTDLNIPFDIEDGTLDMSRLEKVLPTIKHALEHNSRVIIASHLGLPESEKAPALSLEQAAAALAELLDRDIFFFEDCAGMGAQQMVRDLKPGGILVLENLRFKEDEIKNSASFARELAKMCDIYINDAFAISHRTDTSINALPQIMDTKAMGLLMKKEIEEIAKVADFKRGDGLCLALGGAVTQEKLSFIRYMLEIADKIIIGGSLSHLFLAAKGTTLGATKIEDDKVNTAKEIIKSAEIREIEIVLPVDHVAAESIDSTKTKIYSNENFPENLTAYDIGPATRSLFESEVQKGSHLFWNGPFGVCEEELFEKGSIEFAKAAVKLSGDTIAAGEETSKVIRKAGSSEEFKHASEGGETALKLILTGKLPALDALK